MTFHQDWFIDCWVVFHHPDGVVGVVDQDGVTTLLKSDGVHVPEVGVVPVGAGDSPVAHVAGVVGSGVGGGVAGVACS